MAIVCVWNLSYLYCSSVLLVLAGVFLILFDKSVFICVFPDFGTHLGVFNCHLAYWNLFISFFFFKYRKMAPLILYYFPPRFEN